MLLDSGHASTYLAELEQFHNIAIFESPIRRKMSKATSCCA
jgi:hypothetical protein